MSSAAESHRSGRLRLKRSREERHQEYDEYKRSSRYERARQKEKRRRKKLEEEEQEEEIDQMRRQSGPSRHPTALFGDDLLRAERFEAGLREEQSWSAKLGDLLNDDLQGGFSEYGGGGGGGISAMGGAGGDAAWEEEMMRMSGDQFSGEVQQDIPKKWRDAAEGFESRMGSGIAGLKEMDEEEYAEYIREGMYRRKHAERLAFEEDCKKAYEEEQSRKTKAREERKLAKKRKEEAEAQQQSEKVLQLARSEWESKWLGMASQEGNQRQSLGNLPWPKLPDSELTKESIQYFLFHNSEKQEASKRLRVALLRYHPDRFLSSRFFLDIRDEGERIQAKESVAKVVQMLSDIINDRRAA